MNTIGDKVIVQGTSKVGVIVSTRFIPAHETLVGLYGEVRHFTVRFPDGTEMEYEWTELRKAE